MNSKRWALKIWSEQYGNMLSSYGNGMSVTHLKSTIITNIFPLWCICYAEDVEKRYWLLIADKQDNARRFLDVIKSEIEDNELLIADFGNLKGPTWNSLEIITSNQVKLQAAGAGEGLRGLVA